MDADDSGSVGAGSGPFLDLKPPGTASPAKGFPFGSTSITLPTPSRGSPGAADPFGAFASGPGTTSLGRSAAVEALPLFGPSQQEKMIDKKPEMVEDGGASDDIDHNNSNAAGDRHVATAVSTDDAATSAFSATDVADKKVEATLSDASEDEAPQPKRPRHSITPPVDDDADDAAATVAATILTVDQAVDKTRLRLSEALSEALSKATRGSPAAFAELGGDRFRIGDLVRAHKLDVRAEVDSYLKGLVLAGHEAFCADGCAAHLAAIAKRQKAAAREDAEPLTRLMASDTTTYQDPMDHDEDTVWY